MADKKLSGLPIATNVDDNDLVYVVQSGQSKQALAEKLPFVKRSGDTMTGNLELQGAFIDSNGNAGLDGNFLKSTNTGTEWIDLKTKPSASNLSLGEAYAGNIREYLYRNSYRVSPTNLGYVKALELESSLPSPSLHLLPIAAKENELYSIKPVNNIGNFDFTRGSTATLVNSDGFIEEVGANVPRINYDLIDGFAQSTPSLLLEPQSTNLNTNSENLSSVSWSKVNSSVSGGFLSLDGLPTAYKIIEDTNNAQHRLDYSTTSAIGFNTFSVFAKKDERIFLFLRIGTTGAVFNLDAGTSSNNDAGIESSIINYGNGWFRCIITKSNSSLNEISRINLQQNAGIPNYLGNGTSGLFVWGAQFEQGNRQTSYIPTSGTIQTRLVETAEKNNLSNYINSNNGAFYFQVNTLNTSSVPVITVSNGTVTNTIEFAFYGTNSWNIIFRTSAGNTVINGTLDASELNKFCVSYTETDFVVYINGALVGTRQIGASLVGMDRIQFGLVNGNNIYNGNVKDLRIYDGTLTDEQLIKLTTL